MLILWVISLYVGCAPTMGWSLKPWKWQKKSQPTPTSFRQHGHFASGSGEPHPLILARRQGGCPGHQTSRMPAVARSHRHLHLHLGPVVFFLCWPPSPGGPLRVLILPPLTTLRFRELSISDSKITTAELEHRCSFMVRPEKVRLRSSGFVLRFFVFIFCMAN
jgi:hypothetical protein